MLKTLLYFETLHTVTLFVEEIEKFFGIKLEFSKFIRNILHYNGYNLFLAIINSRGIPKLQYVYNIREG